MRHRKRKKKRNYMFEVLNALLRGLEASDVDWKSGFKAALWIRIRRIRMLTSLLDPDPDPVAVVRGTDPALDPDSSIVK
jgi:hypothetical protein